MSGDEFGTVQPHSNRSVITIENHGRVMLSDAKTLVLADFEDGLMIYHPDRNRVHYLNRTAAFVFELHQGGNPLGTITELLGEACGLPQLPTEEVERVVENLLGEGLVSGGEERASRQAASESRPDVEEKLLASVTHPGRRSVKRLLSESARGRRLGPDSSALRRRGWPYSGEANSDDYGPRGGRSEAPPPSMARPHGMFTESDYVIPAIESFPIDGLNVSSAKCSSRWANLEDNTCYTRSNPMTSDGGSND